MMSYEKKKTPPCQFKRGKKLTGKKNGFICNKVAGERIINLT